MKFNSLLILKKTIFIFFILLISKSEAELITFEAKVIETQNNENIIATGDVKIIDKDLIIKSDIFKLNKKNRIHLLKDNVIIEDKQNNKIFSQKLIFNENTGIYTSPDEAIIKISKGYIVETKNLIYNRDKKTYSTNSQTKIKDNLSNTIYLNDFILNLKKNTIKANFAKIIDKENNVYEIKSFFYNLDEKKIYGKDSQVNIDNELLNKRHLARSKSRAFIYEDQITTFHKSTYTNCKKRNGCLPWSINADKVTHDKKKKIVNYEKATLNFYDIPVMYFPKFFHPDPTVKRKSGFLTPTINSQKSEGYINIPYYFVISDSSDFTFFPRIYDNLKNIYQGEYREERENSSHILDFGIKNDNALPALGNSTKTHFFLTSKIKTDYNYFDTSNLDIKIQSVSDEKYLKKFDIKSPIIDSQSVLNSVLDFKGYRDDLDFSVSAEIYEDLTKTNSSDRYEFILPNYSLTKNLYTDSDGLFEFRSSGYIKNFNTNIYEEKLINDISYISQDNYSELGLVKNFELQLKNVNSNSKNSPENKNKLENNLQGIFQYNLELPLQKKNSYFTKSFTPILSVKYNPLNNKNISASDRFVNFKNIFSINRLASNEVLEGGRSITTGAEYKIFKNQNLNDELFQLSLATSLRDKENRDLPIKSSLGQKVSNFVGASKLKLNNYVNLEYDFITKNNMTEFNYHNLKSTIRINNFVTKFEFIEENNNIGNESFLANESLLKINNHSSFLFRTRENKKTNVKEYYDWVYQYKMDCLTAGVKYRKSYYNDGDLKPEESINFSITFMPFDNTVNLPNIY